MRDLGSRGAPGPDPPGAASNQLGLSHFVDDKFEVLRSLWEDPAGNVRLPACRAPDDRTGRGRS